MHIRSLSRIFPPPYYLSLPAAGIDLSDRSLKYIRLMHRKRRYELMDYGQMSLPQGVVSSGQIQDKKALVEVMKKAKADWGLQYVAAALPEESAYIVPITLPPGTEGGEREAIELQLEEHVPLPVSDVIFDFEVLPGKNHQVIVSVFPAQVIRDYEEVMLAAGLQPLALEVEAQAIARAIVPRQEPGTVLAIDFGRTRTSFFIVSGGEVLFSSTTRTLGGNIMTRAIEKNLGLATTEAEILKMRQGLVGSSEASLAAALVPTLSVLRDEILKLDSYWERRTAEAGKSETFSRVLLCGGEAGLPGLVDYLHSQLERRVDMGNVWVNALDPNYAAPALPQRDSLAYATAIGLALRAHHHS